VCAIHARISIHNAHPYGPTPSQDEIEEWLKNHAKMFKGLRERDLMNAFNKEEEVRLELFYLFLIP
jgi:hypothetical protein